jgi:hypothetical protein
MIHPPVVAATDGNRPHHRSNAFVRTFSRLRSTVTLPAALINFANGISASP